MNELVSVGLSGTPYEVRFISGSPNFQNDVPIFQASLYCIYDKERDKIVDVIYVHHIQCFPKVDHDTVEKLSCYIVSESPQVDRVSISDPVFSTFDLVIDYLTSLCEKQKTKVI